MTKHSGTLSIQFELDCDDRWKYEKAYNTMKAMIDDYNGYYDGIKLSYCEDDWVEFDDNGDFKLTKEEVEDSIKNRMSTHWEDK